MDDPEPDPLAVVPDSEAASGSAASDPRTPVPLPAVGRPVADEACRGRTWAGTGVGVGSGDEATRVDSARAIATRNLVLLIVIVDVWLVGWCFVC